MKFAFGSIAALCAFAVSGNVLSYGQNMNVLTWHNDIGRTGQNTNLGSGQIRIAGGGWETSTF